MWYKFPKIDDVIFEKQNSGGICSWNQSNVGEISSGVPQVSILGPLLFLFFINDLPVVLPKNVSATDLNADDTTIYNIQTDLETLRSNLQESLLILQRWCRENVMLLNTGKKLCI